MGGRGEGFGWSLLLEAAPAASLGGALAFAAAAAPAASVASALPPIIGFLGGCGALLLLRSLRGTDASPMPQFEQVALEVTVTQAGWPSEESLLDDTLARPEPDSRVVRLFDRQAVRSCGAIPSPADLQLHSVVRPNPTPPDATEALHEALASLRQSLR